MAIADNFRAIKAALNRLTGAAPSGEAFSGLKDAKRVTGEHDMDVSTDACRRCGTSSVATLDFPAVLAKCPGAPLAAGTALSKGRYFHYEADGKGGVVHMQTQPEPPFPGAQKPAATSDDLLKTFKDGLAGKFLKPVDPMRDAVQPMRFGWSAAAAAAAEYRERLAADILNRAFNTSLDPARPDGMPFVWPQPQTGDAFTIKTDTKTMTVFPNGNWYLTAPPGDASEFGPDQLESVRKWIADNTAAMAARIDHDLGSTQFGPEGTNNCCGNPACPICADGVRRGVEVLSHGPFEGHMLSVFSAMDVLEFQTDRSYTAVKNCTDTPLSVSDEGATVWLRPGQILWSGRRHD